MNQFQDFISGVLPPLKKSHTISANSAIVIGKTKIFFQQKSPSANTKGLGMSGSPDRTIIELFV
jgi:hypothetical protein